MSKNGDFATFEEAEVTSQIASKVFAAEFAQLKDRLARQESLSVSVIIGSVVAMFVVVVGLIWGSWVFIAEYNHHYLEAVKSFSDTTSEIKQENMELRVKIDQLNSTKEKSN